MFALRESCSRRLCRAVSSLAYAQRCLWGSWRFSVRTSRSVPWCLATCLLNRLNKRTGKRRINSACLITSQSGSKGNWRFPRKLSRYAVWPDSPRSREYCGGESHTPGTWCRQSTAEPQNHQKQGRNCIAKCLSPQGRLLLCSLRALGGAREAFQKELKQHFFLTGI